MILDASFVGRYVLRMAQQIETLFEENERLRMENESLKQPTAVTEEPPNGDPAVQPK